MDRTLSKLQEVVKDRKAWCAAGHGVTKSQTQRSNWTTTIYLRHQLHLPSQIHSSHTGLVFALWNKLSLFPFGLVTSPYLRTPLSSSSDSMFLICHLLKCCLPRETCLHLYHITILFYWHTFSEIIYLCKFTFLSYTYCHRGLECRLFETKDFIHFVPSCWIQHLKESRQAFIINQDEQPEPDTPSSLESLENQTKHMKQWLWRQRTSENKRQWT